MTELDYIELCKQRAEAEARDILQNYLRPFEEVKEYFKPLNMTMKRFKDVLDEMHENPSDVNEVGRA